MSDPVVTQSVLQSTLRSELSALGSELHREISALRGEMLASFEHWFGAYDARMDVRFAAEREDTRRMLLASEERVIGETRRMILASEERVTADTRGMILASEERMVSEFRVLHDVDLAQQEKHDTLQEAVDAHVADDLRHRGPRKPRTR